MALGQAIEAVVAAGQDRQGRVFICQNKILSANDLGNLVAGFERVDNAASSLVQSVNVSEFRAYGDVVFGL